MIAFSQTDTDTKFVKCFPEPVLRMMLKDLISGDSAKSMLVIQEEEIRLMEDKISVQDSIINSYRFKEENYEKIINEYNKFKVLEDYIENLEGDLKQEKKNNRLKTISSIGLIGTLTYFLITK